MDETHLLPPMIARYFRGIDEGDFAAVLSAFSEAATYSHPGVGRGEERVTLRGRDKIADFMSKRGVKPWHHVIEHAFSSVDHCLVEGLVKTESATVGSFMSSVSLDSGGLMTRYVTYTSFPPPAP